MGRPPTGKPREWVRLPQWMWERLAVLASKNHRTRDLQIEAMLSELLDPPAPMKDGERRDFIAGREMPRRDEGRERGPR